MKHEYPIQPWNQSISRWNGNTHPLPSRQSQTNAVKAQDYGSSVLGRAWCFSGELYATRNNDQLRCLLHNSTEVPKNVTKERHGMLSKGALLFHDNASPHTSRKTRNLIEYFGLEVLNHAPYSPYLASSDFHLFWYLKHSLGGKRFSDKEEVKADVNSWLSDHAADFFEKVSYDCTWQIQNPDVVEDLLRLRSCHRNSTLGIIWAEARPFVTPFAFQYCIAAAALQYALWKSPPSRSQAASQQQRMDCRGSSKGLFLGLLVLAVGIVALILYFVLAHNPGLKEETLLVMGSAHAALLLLALLAAMLALCRVGGMCASSDAESGAITLHHILENVGLCALFFQGGCALVAALQDDVTLAVLSEGGKAISQSSAVLITLADAALALTHALAQSLLFHRLEQRQCSDGCPHERPGRQVITFLAFCNLVLWVTDTFASGRDQSSAQLQLKLFGALPWKLISQLTMPLVMLYRFQSTVYLLEVWHTGYGTDPK
ncbi:hypothetical protein TNCV_4821381 [Trichonephila clavipes]|nr:hypothetical protein TNCV_4821381 [Trichonephila clavipes]